jgi:glucose-1-phosphate thymidylyltransferase
MRGVILAGGTGSRLWPATKAVSKQLMPIHDKPMIYYPLTTLITAGVREVLIIVAPDQEQSFRALLGDGTQWGMAIHYGVQPRPEGIAQALVIGSNFLKDNTCALVLGDNLFHGNTFECSLQKAEHTLKGSSIFAAPVAHPEHYGVVEFDSGGSVISLTEKPQHPRSRYAVPGLYFFDERASEIAQSLTPSSRGELEIMDVARRYWELDSLTVTPLDRGTAWLDTGTFDTLTQASEYVRIIEGRQGGKIGCVEESVWRAGWISDMQLWDLAQPLIPSGYGHYLQELIQEVRNEQPS